MVGGRLGPAPSDLLGGVVDPEEVLASEAVVELSRAWEAAEAGGLAQALESANRALPATADHPALLGWARLLLGHVARLRGDLVGAAGQLGQAFSSFDDVDDTIGRVRVLVEAGRVSADADDLDAATDAVGAALHLLATAGSRADSETRPVIAGAIACTARLAHSLDDPESSLRLLSASAGMGWADDDTAVLADELAVEIPRSEHVAVCEAGRGLSVGDAIELALARCGSWRRVGPADGPTPGDFTSG